MYLRTSMTDVYSVMCFRNRYVRQMYDDLKTAMQTKKLSKKTLSRNWCHALPTFVNSAN
jgi:hypothetical protein